MINFFIDEDGVVHDIELNFDNKDNVCADIFCIEYHNWMKNDVRTAQECFDELEQHIFNKVNDKVKYYEKKAEFLKLTQDKKGNYILWAVEYDNDIMFVEEGEVVREVNFDDE